MITTVAARVTRNSSTTGQIGVGLLGFYIFISHVFVPLLSPLRATGQMEPGEIRNLLLPPLLVLLVLSCRPGQVLRPRSLLHVVLITVGFQAAAFGYDNYIFEYSRRDYFSHLFQVSSAYVMLGVGWSIGAHATPRFWKLMAYLTFVSVSISTALTLGALESGDVGRYYTPAYALILTSSFAALNNTKLWYASLFMVLISNKRAVMLSILALLVHVSILKRWQGWNRRRFHPLDRFALAAISLTVLVAVFSAFVMWASNPENATTGLGRAANISYERMARSLEVGTSSTDISDIDAGRSEEVQAALSSLTSVDIAFGSGAGWSVNVGDGKFVQNIHFTPLSLTAVFGAPFAIYLYLVLIYYVMRATFSRGRHAGSLAEKMAPLYVGAALVHSIFAYSLFIDWLVFFFVGVMQSSARSGARSGLEVPTR